MGIRVRVWRKVTTWEIFETSKVKNTVKKRTEWIRWLVTVNL